MTDEPMDPKTSQETSQEAEPVPARAASGPADLAELKATDALLDRLASGGLDASDRDDPLISAFAQLRRSLDEPSQDDGHNVARLIEVLGDRPLYLVDVEEAGDGSLADTPINLGLPAGQATRTVDVRGAGQDAGAAGSDELADTRQPVPPTPLRRPVLPQPAAQVAARVGDVTTAAIGATVRTINSMTAGRRATHGRLDDEDKPNWRRVAEQVAVPAASIVAVLTIGYGVSAAVTGDPMAPVAGVSRVVQQLPGMDDDAPSEAMVVANIKMAGRLARTPGREAQAQSLIKQADDNVEELPEAAQPSLKTEINKVKLQLANPATPSVTPVATPPVSSPSAAPSVVASPSATAPTTTAPTTPNTLEPSTSATAPTSSAATDPAP